MSDDTTPPPPPPPPPSDLPPPPPPPPPYGSMSPPPPSPYGAPVPGGAPYSPVDAIKYGWARFSKSPATILVPALIVIVSVGVVEAIVQTILRASLLGTHDCTTNVITGVSFTTQCGPGFFANLVGGAFASAVAGFFGQCIGAGLIKSALNVVDGRPVQLGDLVTYATKPTVITTAALISAATFVGTLLCILPSIAVAFLTAFAMFFVVDKDMEPVPAIKASATFMISHVGETILFYLLTIVVVVVGVLACLVGIFAAVPVVVIGAAYTFRVLNGEPVAPAA